MTILELVYNVTIKCYKKIKLNYFNRISKRLAVVEAKIIRFSAQPRFYFYSEHKRIYFTLCSKVLIFSKNFWVYFYKRIRRKNKTKSRFHTVNFMASSQTVNDFCRIMVS